MRLRVEVGSLRARSPLPRDVDGDLVTEWWLPVDVAPGHEQPRRADPLRRARRTPRRDRRALRSSPADGGGRRPHDRRRAHPTSSPSPRPRRPRCPGRRRRPRRRRGATGRCSTASRHPPTSPDSATALRDAHSAAHGALYAAALLELPARPPTRHELDTAERVRRAQERPTRVLAALAFHYGRYLLIASSQPGGLPDHPAGPVERRAPGPMVERVHDQHQHADGVLAGRDDRPARVPRAAAALHRGASPTTTGAGVARELYGADGWVAHHNSDAWAHAAPVGAGHGDPAWANWSMGGVWLALHLWEHYAFGARPSPSCATRRGRCCASAAAFALSWIQRRRRARLDEPVDLAREPLRRRRRPRARRRDDRDDGRRAAAGARRRVPRRAPTALGEDAAVGRRSSTARTDALPDPRVSGRGDLLEWDRRGPSPSR